MEICGTGTQQKSNRNRSFIQISGKLTNRITVRHEGHEYKEIANCNSMLLNSLILNILFNSQLEVQKLAKQIKIQNYIAQSRQR